MESVRPKMSFRLAGIAASGKTSPLSEHTHDPSLIDLGTMLTPPAFSLKLVTEKKVKNIP